MSITSRPVSYTDDGIALSGVLAWDESIKQRRPGVLVIHGGAGLDDHANEQARRYAALGYVALACDMFGDGVAGDREKVMTTILGFRESPELLSRRGRAGLEALMGCPEVDGRCAAVGFCFGGLAVLTLARSGAELACVVSIHGGLATSSPAEPGSIKAKVLVCHGALDPHVPMAEADALVDEMNHAQADWQLIVYGGAMHGFTHQRAVPGAIPGVAYDALADERSFAATRSFLAETLPAS